MLPMTGADVPTIAGAGSSSTCAPNVKLPPCGSAAIQLQPDDAIEL